MESNGGILPKLIAIVGPTGVGKTDLSEQIVRYIDSEIVSIDSRQIYRKMDIGTAKPTSTERKKLKHYLIDEILPISDDEAMDIGRRLAKEEGLLSGVSSGAAVAAALKIGAREDMKGKRLVVILPSFGERYLSTSMFSGI